MCFTLATDVTIVQQSFNLPTLYSVRAYLNNPFNSYPIFTTWLQCTWCDYVVVVVGLKPCVNVFFGMWYVWSWRYINLDQLFLFFKKFYKVWHLLTCLWCLYCSKLRLSFYAENTRCSINFGLSSNSISQPQRNPWKKKSGPRQTLLKMIIPTGPGTLSNNVTKSCIQVYIK